MTSAERTPCTFSRRATDGQEVLVERIPGAASTSSLGGCGDRQGWNSRYTPVSRPTGLLDEDIVYVEDEMVDSLFD